MIVLKGRGVVEGRAFGKTLVVDDYISFLGEIERSSGVLRKKGFPETSVAGRILFFKGSKGSTVGPYVMYDLCKRGLAPSAMIVEKADQLVIISGVLCNIVLIEVREWDLVKKIPNDVDAEAYASERDAEVKIYV
ncbi:MAG: DUF126 domain-containing protein [Desulfurococcaceae archaeon]|jgi:predicted aconitase with swiveling domain|nr:DUF126 domain-containing protein [Desulfurococcaceae archaeon]